VPTLGCPAKGSSVRGVKMRTRYEAVGSVGALTNVDSEYPNSAASVWHCAVVRSPASRTTASWLPLNGWGANTSTTS
jgi:hypothetical protein